MLPHDALAMVFTDQDRHFVHQAESPEDFPDPVAVSSKTPIPDEHIIGDLTERLAVLDPPDAFTPVINAGYRAVLMVGFRRTTRHLARVLVEAAAERYDRARPAGGASHRRSRRARRSRTSSCRGGRDAAEAQARAAPPRSAGPDCLATSSTRKRAPRRRALGGMARRVQEGDPGRGDRHHRARHRRVRHRQGSRRPVHPSRLRAQAAARLSP